MQLISQSRQELQRLYGRLIRAKSAHTEANNQFKSNALTDDGGIARRLQQSRVEELAEESRQALSAWEHQKALVEMRENINREGLERFIQVNIGPFLETIRENDQGQTPADPEGRRAPSQAGGAQNDDTPMDHEDTGDHENHHSDGNEEQAPDEERPEAPPIAEAESSDLSNISLTELRNRYTSFQDELAQVQNSYNSEINERRLLEADHLLTFTDSTPESYEQVTAQQLQDRMDDIEEIENDLIALREELTKRGASIPRTPSAERSLHSVRRGGISKGSSASPRSTASTRERREVKKQKRVNN